MSYALNFYFWIMNKIKNHPAFKILTNKYMVAFIFFAVWMTFLDTNSYLIHRDLNKEKNQLAKDISFYETELVDMRRELNELESDPKAFEKYAREKFWMHQPGENIVLIEYKEK